MGRPQPKGWAAWLWIGFFALVDGTLFQGFLAEGLLRTNAGLGSVMIDSQPLAVAMLSAWLFGEIIGVVGWLGLGLGVLGISSIGLPDEWMGYLLHPGTTSVTVGVGQLFEHGEWLMLLAALSMAVGTVTIRFVCQYADAVTATGWHMILGGLPLFALSGIWESEQWVHIDAAGWMALAYSTIFGSAIAYGLFFYFASTGNLTSLSALTFLTPVFAVVFGNLFLSEVLSPVQSIGVAITLISIYLINQREAIGQKLHKQATPPKDVETTTPIEPSPNLNIPLLEADSRPLAPVSSKVLESDSEILPNS
jgi:drug/metabolite transporter (DMT)-like permease